MKMGNIRSKAFRTLYFYLITAGLPTLMCSVLLGNARLGIIGYAVGILLAFPLSLLPGHIGKNRSVPLRFPYSLAVCILIIVLGAVCAIQTGVLHLRGAIAGAVAGVLMLFCVRDVCAEDPVWTGQHCATIGIVLYGVPGVAFMVLEQDPMLENLTWILALVYLVVTAFTLNTSSVRTGLATRRNARPPQSLISGNRVLTVIFVCIGALVIFWGQLRDAAVRFGKWVGVCIMWLIHKLINLFGSSSSSGGQDSTDTSQMFAEFGETTPSQFWLIMEKIMIVMAIILGIVLVCVAARVIFRLILKLVRVVRAYMTRFAQSAGEDYDEEQVDLFDLDDIREQTKERLQKAIRRFTERPPKWENMDVRERVRYCVRSLYARAGYSNGELRSLTIREAAPMLPPAGISEDELANLYEKARYSTEEPTAQEADDLRKAVKP